MPASNVTQYWRPLELHHYERRDSRTSLAKITPMVIQCAHHAKLKEDTEAIDVTVSELQRLCMALDPDSVPENENEKALYRLAEGCKTVSEEIIDLLGKIKPRDCSSKIQNMSSAIKLKLYERQLSEREVRLNAYQKQLELQLNYMSR
ncbi:hypothetical protein APSETT444_008801 [Aspergillus pseudonomiae]